MFHVKNHKQLNILDPWGHLGPKRRALLDNSWAGLFQQHILPELPVESLRQHYHDYNGRPTKELHAMMGLMILQQMHDCTDQEAVEQFCFNIQWHYALNITSGSDTAAYISHKTLWTMRDHLASDVSYAEIFDTSLSILAKLLKADMSKQRMDSVHVKSNMRNLGRIGLFTKTIKKFLVNLKRHHRELFDQLDTELIQRYLSTSQASVFAMVKPTESSRTLDQLAADVLLLIERFATVDEVRAMQSFKLLSRLFSEQCVIEEDATADSGTKAVARPNKDVPSDSLQNPSDPDAGYSSHKGQGYQVQVVENYTTTDERGPSLITHVEVESADQHDANALLPTLNQLEQKEMLPQQLLVDSIYGSDSNCETARQEYQVAVISPVMPGNQKKFHLAEFTLDDQGKVLACPQGTTPDTVKKAKSGYSVVFPIAACQDCPSVDQCPVSTGKKGWYYRYTDKDIRLARRRQEEASPTFREKYRYRAGVEATMSEFDRRTGVKHLRVRGIKAVRFAAFMKAIGLNILRAGRHWGEKNSPMTPCFSLVFLLLVLQAHFKELIREWLSTRARLSKNYQPTSSLRRDLAV
ncbi:transposase [Desulfobulbus alkaliphilus]|uniref:transposase n=1 Tax=Desulfobulbus alkaliphilus TaxID=869814 RepID=UPI001962AD34|nr:transposase [Desulfobulbus alkaliphilus]MBM9535645.1 transposase [Desulfobulbus alkaliphilus]